MDKTFTYEVIVGNLGCVERTDNLRQAENIFSCYVYKSTHKEGRSAGENVVIMKRDEIYKEFIGSIEKNRTEEDRLAVE